MDVTLSNEKKVNTPYSVRLPEDLKAQLTDTLGASGYSAPEFFSKMVSHFQIQEGIKPQRPEMKEIQKGIKRIMDAMESLALAVEITETDKAELSIKYAAEIQITAQELEQAQDRTVEVEQVLKQAQKETEEAQAAVETIRTKMQKEIDRLLAVEGMIDEVRQEAKEAKIATKTTEKERDNALTIMQTEKAKSAAYESENKDLVNKLESYKNEVTRITSELNIAKETSKDLAKQLNGESMSRNRLEAKMEIMEPQIQAALAKIENLQTENSRLQIQAAKAPEELKTDKSPFESVINEIEQKAPNFIK